jgi:hypothetical protein
MEARPDACDQDSGRQGAISGLQRTRARTKGNSVSNRCVCDAKMDPGFLFAKWSRRPALVPRVWAKWDFPSLSAAARLRAPLLQSESRLTAAEGTYLTYSVPSNLACVCIDAFEEGEDPKMLLPSIHQQTKSPLLSSRRKQRVASKETVKDASWFDGHGASAHGPWPAFAILPNLAARLISSSKGVIAQSGRVGVCRLQRFVFLSPGSFGAFSGRSSIASAR